VGPRLAVLDMVGTTVEAGREVPDAFREAFRRVGVSLTDEAVNEVRGRSKTDAIAALVSSHLPDLRDPAEVSRKVYADFRSILQTLYETSARPIPGAASAIADLRQLGLHVVLTTGLDRDTVGRIVHGLGWESLGLAGIVTGDDVLRGRPAPDLIHAAMELVSLDDPGSVVVVGDTISDLQAAACAGAGWAVGVLTGAHTGEQLRTVSHSVILESMALVPSWLQRVCAWH
jgi:phosphonatase-like hydrolase